ncbi:MAG: ParB N-terminal domain-containing protein [Bacillota bacterium]|jgi:hypothetical protein
MRRLTLVFGLLEVQALARHEEVIPEHLAALTAEIAEDGELREPIVVDRHTLVILDGHHRAEAVRALGCSLIPAYLVDYADPAIRVTTRRSEIALTKEAVVRTGLSGTPYPPKTSRHLLPGRLPSRPTPLGRLRA